MESQVAVGVNPEVADLQMHQPSTVEMHLQSTKTFDNALAAQAMLDVEPEDPDLEVQRPSITGIYKMFFNQVAQNRVEVAKDGSVCEDTTFV